MSVDGMVWVWRSRWDACARWRADGSDARQDVDDGHRGTAVAAHEGRLRVADRVIRFVLGDDGSIDVKQLTQAIQVEGSLAVGDEAVVADAMKSPWQDVQQEAAHELVGRQCHGLVPRAPRQPIVLPAEGHAMLVVGDETAVGDGNAVGVAR